mgnify:CR=1 FL=1
MCTWFACRVYKSRQLTKHGNLGRQSKVTLNCGIQLLELKLSKRAGTIGCFKRLLEGILLFLRRQELYLRG